MILHGPLPGGGLLLFGHQFGVTDTQAGDQQSRGRARSCCARLPCIAASRPVAAAASGVGKSRSFSQIAVCRRLPGRFRRSISAWYSRAEPVTKSPKLRIEASASGGENPASTHSFRKLSICGRARYRSVDCRPPRAHRRDRRSAPDIAVACPRRSFPTIGDPPGSGGSAGAVVVDHLPRPSGPAVRACP